MSEEKEDKPKRVWAPVMIGPPIFPRDPSEYPGLILCDEERAVVAISRHKGYLLYRDGLAKSEIQDIEDLQEKYRMEIAGGKWRWAMEAIGKPVPDDW